MQQHIIDTLGVQADIDLDSEIVRRVKAIHNGEAALRALQED